MALGGLSKGGGLFGNLFGGSPSQCPQNANKSYVIDEEELYLERQAAANNLATTKQYYEGVIGFNKTLTDSFFAAYERDVKNSFDLYKLSRDQKDELIQRIEAVDKKVDVMAAVRPYQDALINAKIDTNGIVKQVKNASGEVVTPTILKYEVTNNDQEHTAIQEGHILAKKSGNTPTKETYRVRVEYRNDEGINPEDLDDTND